MYLAAQHAQLDPSSFVCVGNLKDCAVGEINMIDCISYNHSEQLHSGGAIMKSIKIMSIEISRKTCTISEME